MNTNSEKRLLDYLYDFQTYLGLGGLWTFYFTSFGSDDFMKSEGENIIYFNRDFLKIYPSDFALLVLIHEAYHAIKQGIVNKPQVNVIRDSVGWLFMQLLDVEADLVTVKYLKEKHQISLRNYLAIHQMGTRNFLNETPRRPKFERFIGSMLSIHRLFQYQEEAIYLPNLSIPFRLVLIKQGQGLNFYIGEERYNFDFISSFQELYSNQDKMPFEEFLNSLKHYIEDFQDLFRCFSNSQNIPPPLVS